MNVRGKLINADFVRHEEGRFAEEFDDINFRWLTDGEVDAIVNSLGRLPTDQAKRHFVRCMITELGHNTNTETLGDLIKETIDSSVQANKRYSQGEINA